MDYLRKMINERLQIMNGGMVVEEKTGIEKLQDDLGCISQYKITQKLLEANINEVILKYNSIILGRNLMILIGRDLIKPSIMFLRRLLI
jgi:hypothetical protein